MTKSKKTSKRVKNLTLEWNQKQQHFFPHASRWLLCIRFVAVDFWSEEEVRWRRGPRVTYFWPALDPPLGRSGRKTTTLVRDHEYFIPTKFHQNLSSGSGEEVENMKSLRRTDGRRTVRYDNNSFEPSAQASEKWHNRSVMNRYVTSIFFRVIFHKFQHILVLIIF